MFHLTIVLLLSVVCHTAHSIMKMRKQVSKATLAASSISNFYFNQISIHQFLNKRQQYAPYIKPCSKSEPNFNKCALQNGNAAISSIVKGDPKYHIPCLDPLKLDQINLEGNNNLKLYATDFQLFGLKSGELTDIDWNLNSKTIKIHIHFPVLRAIGQYNLDGRVLIMNLKGTGPMNNTHSNCQILMYGTYDVYSRKEKEYLKLTNLTIEFLNEHIHFQFDNLLNNEQISNQMNSFLNENWKVVVKDVIPSINKVIKTLILSVVNPLAEKVPLDAIITT